MNNSNNRPDLALSLRLPQNKNLLHHLSPLEWEFYLVQHLNHHHHHHHQTTMTKTSKRNSFKTKATKHFSNFLCTSNRQLHHLHLLVSSSLFETNPWKVIQNLTDSSFILSVIIIMTTMTTSNSPCSDLKKFLLQHSQQNIQAQNEQQQIILWTEWIITKVKTRIIIIIV